MTLPAKRLLFTNVLERSQQDYDIEAAIGK
jgi:hypothetical protein